MPPNFRNYHTIDLIRYIAFAPQLDRNWNAAFAEFDRRYYRLLMTVIYRKCVQLGYEKGLAALDDLLQNTYLKLLKNDRAGFKEFQGTHERQFQRYLQVTANRVVLNNFHREEMTASRSPSGGLQSLDQVLDRTAKEAGTSLKDLLPDPGSNEELAFQETIEEIRYCLKQSQRRNKQADRNMLIFQLRIFAGLEAEEIGSRPEINVAPKTVLNLTKKLAKAVASCLEKRFRAR